MNDYISRQDMKDALQEKVFHNLTDEFYGAMQVLDELPAADVVPVVHGKWIPHREKSREYIGAVLVHVRYDYWLCDTCGYRVENGQPMYNFCPNCGAKMDGERKEFEQRLSYKEKTQMTNRERLAKMNDEEFAGALCDMTENCEECIGTNLCKYGDGHGNGLLKWLENEVEEEA